MSIGEVEGTRFLLCIQELQEHGRVSSVISVLWLGYAQCIASGI